MDAVRYATFWWRFLAVFLDCIILGIPAGIIGAILGVFGAVFATAIAGDSEDAVGALMSLFMLGLQGLSLLASWLYYALMESSPWQATLGKKICGLQVTDLDGGRISFARASGRFFGRIVSAIPCYVGFLLPFFTEKKQALHDMLAGTLIIYKPAVIQPMSSQAPIIQ